MADVRPLHPYAPAIEEKYLIAPETPLRHLIPGGADLELDQSFGEEVWDLAGHRSWTAKAGGQTTFDFSKLSPRWRVVAQHLSVFQMNPQLVNDLAPEVPMAQTWARSQEATKPVTSQGNLKMLLHATAILDRYHLTTFDEDTWDRVVSLLITPQSKEEKRDGAILSAGTGRGRAQQLSAFWEVTHIVGRTDLLGANAPFGGRETTELYERRGPRNSVRPDDAVGQMLGFTGWFIDHALEDIVETIEWWSSNAAAEPPGSQQGNYDAMLDLLCRIAADNNGDVPGVRNINGGLTLAHGALGRLIGEFDAVEAFLAGRWAMRHLGDQVTLSEDLSPCPVELTTIDTPAGLQTWTRRLLPVNSELDLWQRYAIYACMFYLSATLMLRDSQLSCLPLNAITTEPLERPDGTTVDQHTLKAYRTKNRHSPVPTSVVVSSRTARIMTLLQRLQKALGYQPALAVTGLPFMFDQRLAVPFGKEPRSGARDGLYLDTSFDKLLRNAASLLFDRGVITRSLEGTKVNARQVRITCGQAYASREHGAALAAAYGQWDSRQVAAGYVGDVYKRLITPVDPEDVDDEIMMSKGEALVAARNQRPLLTGRGLPRLDEALERSEPKLANPAPLTPARKRALGKTNRNLHQGTLTLCLWQLEGAMCGGQAGPDFARCAPGECRNSVMTPGNRARSELMRRQYLTPDTVVGRRGAARLDNLNPDIKVEFADKTDDELRDLVKQQYDNWVAATLQVSQ